MKLFKQYILVICVLFSLPIFANVDQYSDTQGGIDLHIEVAEPYAFDNKGLDKGNIVVGVDNKFSANKSGVYKVHYQLNWSTDNLNRKQVKTYIIRRQLAWPVHDN